jgi:hypothetical protein
MKLIQVGTLWRLYSVLAPESSILSSLAYLRTVTLRPPRHKPRVFSAARSSAVTSEALCRNTVPFVGRLPVPFSAERNFYNGTSAFSSNLRASHLAGSTMCAHLSFYLRYAEHGSEMLF